MYSNILHPQGTSHLGGAQKMCAREDEKQCSLLTASFLHEGPVNVYIKDCRNYILYLQKVQGETCKILRGACNCAPDEHEIWAEGLHFSSISLH